jgi:SPP1 family predicted phage head-tail adaptor
MSLNKKISITRPGQPTQTAGGGLVPGNPTATMTKWAKVEDRSGSLQVDSAQREWNYDYKVTVRYTKSFVEKGGDLIAFDGKTLSIQSVSFKDEGNKSFVVLRCSVNE